MAGGMRLQSDATTGNGNEVNCRGIGGGYILSVQAAGTITGGEVQWEESPTPGYTGAWRALGAPVTPLENTTLSQAIHGPLNRVRARISADVTGGGSVTVRMQTPMGLVGSEV